LLVPAKISKLARRRKGGLEKEGLEEAGLEREILEREGLFSLLILERKHLDITVPPAEACPRPIH
jgi:hypothetical protein